jgi:hypothetical protein
MRQVVAVFATVIICMFGLVMVVQAQGKAPGVVILKGNPIGGVKFDHTAHTKLAGEMCVTCHHASKPEKAAKAAQEKCQSCHTKAATAPMKTTAKLAFHDGMAKAGICIDCHGKEAKAGKKAPMKSVECHKKANG